FAPVIARYDPNRIDLRAREEAPSSEHWLGTDRTGRDVWARTIYAGRISLSVGLVSVTIATLIGTTLGALSGFYGGAVDNVIMRITDVVMTFPSLIIILTIVAIVGPSIFNVMLVIGLLNWPQAARIVRGQVLATRAQQYVEAARCLGLRNGRIIRVHVLPAVVAPMTVYISFGIAARSCWKRV
ncbi:MAG: ABC transporter permease, partial [Caldilineaceae bacterium]|nr:ABC transporter permease [Caldilineaceae bacterium]